jgi:Domain of unknown function (DUF4333)
VIVVEAPRPQPHRRRAPLASVLGVLALATLSACGGSSSSLDTTRIEHAVAASILAQRGLHTTVSCPSNIPVKLGQTFTCTAKLEVGTYPVTVTETSSNGRVHYGNERPLVALNVDTVQHAIAASILHQRRLNAAVSCPKEVLQQAGITFTCTALVAGNTKRYPFVVTQVNDSGRVRYEGR